MADDIRDILSTTSSQITSLQLYVSSQKRPASPSFEGMDDNASRKRQKEEVGEVANNIETMVTGQSTPIIDGVALVDGLVEELHCGCCAALVYRPVIVSPCQHFFCGSCCVQWIRNGGTNCPSCRGVSNVVTPFRAMQPILDLITRTAPHIARTERERMQADEIYKGGTSMRLPAPRSASPEPNINQSTEYARPCPHCSPDNTFGWSCPVPIADPNIDVDHAWPLEDGLPPGHQHCGNCENLLGMQAPSTTKCDFCQVYFCGIEVQGRCVAAPLLIQHPHGMADVGDLIQSADVYDCFDGNTVEVEIMLDYLAAQGITPRHIYREVVAHLQSQPGAFRPLIDLDLFVDNHSVTPGIDPDPDAPRNRICRLCAAEVLLWGLREWWVRERQKGFLEENVMSRKDCPEGPMCSRQKDLTHAREFNHIFAPPTNRPEVEAPSQPEFSDDDTPVPTDTTPAQPMIPPPPPTDDMPADAVAIINQL